MPRLLVLLLAILLAVNANALDYFPLDQVRLLDSPFKQAQDRNLEYIMAMEPDRLLAPYLLEAGLDPRAENYGNWEGSGLNGHIGGHYLSALSLAYSATGRQDVLNRLHYMLDELQRAQQANRNGYLGGVPGGDEFWLEIAEGDIRADLFALNGFWVPWYNVHKTFAGLRDAWLYTGSEQARDMLIVLAGWATRLVSGLADEQIQTMLTTEHGGMNEVFADVAAITDDKRFMELARQFSHRNILDPLIGGEDRLSGLHANTQIPKVIGFERIAQEEGNTQWHDAALFFWDTVVRERSVAIGGNSVREHFHDKNDFSSMIDEVEGPETCNTYNMLRLTRLLYAANPETRFVEYYERALYNHILSSQDPDTGGLVYFTPMRPQHYRVYSQVHDGMWCCVGSGIENHVKYGEFIYAYDGDDLYVNLFIPSRLTWPEKSLTLFQDNDFPDRPSTRLTFENDAKIRLMLRYPAWAADDQVVVTINGKQISADAGTGTYIALDREWKKGDTIELGLPMATRTEQMPDGSEYYAILYGPVVLAAKTWPFEGEVLNYYADDSRMGHIPRGRMCPLERSPVFVSDSPGFADQIERVPGDDLRFQFAGQNAPAGFENLELIPFYQLHHSRYMLYWPYSTPGQLEEQRMAQARAGEARLILESRTIDKVAPGEQQPESDHEFSGENTEAGVNGVRHWRHAAGWFGYRLNDPGNEARYLRIDYFGADRGRSFTIEMNGVVIADVELTGDAGPVFQSVDYPVPAAVLSAGEGGRHRLRFIAAEGSIAGGIYGVRLLRAAPAR